MVIVDDSFKKLKTIFGTVLGKLKRRNGDLYPCPHICMTSPIINITYQDNIFSPGITVY